MAFRFSRNSRSQQVIKYLWDIWPSGWPKRIEKDKVVSDGQVFSQQDGNLLLTHVLLTLMDVVLITVCQMAA